MGNAAIHLLGPVSTDFGGQVVPLPPSPRAVLAYLALNASRSVPGVELIEALEMDTDEFTGKRRLAFAVFDLRKRMAQAGAPEIVETTDVGYALGSSWSVDSVRLLEQLARARELASTHPNESAELLGDALESFGPDTEPLVDLLHLGFAVEANRRLKLSRHTAIAELLEIEVWSGGTDAALGERIRAEVGTNPADERLYSVLMTYEYRRGRQAIALDTARDARSVLADEYGITAHPIIDALERRILAQDPDLLPGTDSEFVGRSVTPRYETRFFGRASDEATIAEALASNRLVTLVGPGGAGKTRLAVQSTSSYGEEVVFVDLTLAQRDADILPVVAAAVGAGGTDDQLEAIVTTLSEQPSLLVLDNCEHVLGHVASLVRSVLGRTPVTVLATSRHPLGVDAERVMPVGGIDDADSSDAVGLFIDRARLVLPGFDPVPEDREIIAAICRARDSLPLAIELAASWTFHLSLEEIALALEERRIPESLRLSEGGRHDSMESVVNWSFSLLNDRDQIVLRRCSALEPGFTRDLVLRVCDDLPSLGVERSLARLVSHQLLVPERLGRVARYRMLETVRASVAERQTDDDLSKVTHGGTSWAITIASDAGPRLEQPGRLEVFEALDQELPNLIGAARLGVAQDDPETAFHVLWRLQLYVIARTPIIGTIIDVGLEAFRTPTDADATLRTAASVGLGVIAFNGGVMEVCERSLMDARDSALKLDDARWIGNASHELGRCLMRLRRREEAVVAFREAVAASRRLGEPISVARDLADLAGAERPAGQLASLDEALLIARGESNVVLHSYVAAQLAWLRVGLGDAAGALSPLGSCLEEYRAAGNDGAVAEMLWCLADAQHDEPDRARATLEDSLEAAERGQDSVATMIARIRLAEVDPEHFGGGLPSLGDTSTSDLDAPTRGRLELAHGRLALGAGQGAEAYQAFRSAGRLFTDDSYPSWRAVTWAMLALTAPNPADAVSAIVRSLDLFTEALHGPFLLDGFLFPELGSARTIGATLELLCRGQRLDVSVAPFGEGGQAGLEAVDSLLGTIEDIRSHLAVI